MTATSILKVTILTMTILPLTALTDPPASASDSAGNTSVVVMRGGQVQTEARSKSTAGRPKQGDAVVVMRPAPGSFMRETTRLAAEAQAREERAAQQAAQESNRQLSEALQAVEDAAKAVRTQPRKTRVLVLTPPVRTGAIDPNTGKFHPAVEGGVVDPETGRFIPTP